LDITVNPRSDSLAANSILFSW